MRNLRSVLGILVILAWSALSVQAAVNNFEFEFFYQVIEEVIPQNTSVRSAVAANGAKAAIPALKNKIAQKMPWGTADTPLPLDVIRKKAHRPISRLTAGQDTITSEDKKTKYKVNRVKITSEAQLLSLMGVADGNESKLTNGQKALLSMYRFSKNPRLIEQMKKGFREKVTIVVTDTNGHNSDTVRADFWPCASDGQIQFNDLHFDRPDAIELARSVFIHEAAHTLDKTWQEYEQPYGPDGAHYVNELTKPKAAFMEGWAQFAQMYYSADDERYIRQALQKVKIEGPEAGKYTEVDPQTLSGRQLLSVEGCNALIFLDLSRSLPCGSDGVFDAFMATNQRDRTLANVLKFLADKYPGQIETIADVVDRYTFGKLTRSEFAQLLGNSAGLTAWLARRDEARSAAAAATAPSADVSVPSGANGQTGSVTPAKVEGGNPYEDY